MVKYFYNSISNKLLITKENETNEFDGSHIEISQEQFLDMQLPIDLNRTYSLVNGELVLDEENIEQRKKEQRMCRTALLLSCDWTILPDSPLSEIKQQEWRTYRQQLRDFPSQEGFPNIPFPQKPE